MAAPMKMAKQDAWMVLRADTTSWMFTSLPLEVAHMLGCTEPVVEKVPRHLRTISFLGRGPGRLRMVPTFNSQELLQKEMYNVVAVAQINPRNAIRIVERVSSYLEMTVHRREKGGVSYDPIAFVAPAHEYQAYVEALVSGVPFSTKGVGHVYLTKPLIKGKWVWPELAELEAPRSRPLVVAR